MTYISCPVILPHLEDYLINVIPWILVSCDMKNDLKIYVGQFDLYFMVQWLCLMSRRLFDREMSYLE